MPSADDIRKKLETSQRELLDLTFRNSLLNYRPLKARGVEALGADPAAIFQALVRRNQRLSFNPMRSEEDGATQDDELNLFEDAVTPQLNDEFAEDISVGEKAGGLTVKEELDALEQFFLAMEAAQAAEVTEESAPEEAFAPTWQTEVDFSEESEPYADADDVAARPNGATATPITILATACTPTELQKRLLSTQYTARTCIEEQGVNTLFLALGMLEWYEADAVSRPRRSPLLLIPVELERARAGDRFYLRYTGEDIGDNPSLRTLLTIAFRIALPTIPQQVDDLDIDKYLAKVERSIHGRKRWRVDREAVALGFFSFSKYLMFKDLEEALWPDGHKPSEHGVIGSLLGTGFHEPDARYTDDQHLDAVLPPSATRAVMDADSSQALAIEDVKQGRNLVIQGPPGTGKSQTITNIIAEAVGQGKTVLFVAEKRAALEVVKQRLDQHELGSACLEIHSNKASKQTVIQEIKQAWDLGKPVVRESAAEISLLEAARNRLNAYSDVINSPIGQSSLSLYQVYGEWLLLRAKDVESGLRSIEMPDCETWSFADFRQRERLVVEFETHLAQMGVPARHPYWGSRRIAFLPTEYAAAQTIFQSALTAVRSASSRSASLASALGLTPPETPAVAEVLARAVRRAVEAPEFDGMQFATKDWLARRDDLNALLEQGERLHGLRETYGTVLLPEAWDADVLETRQAVAAHGAKWYRFFIGDWRRAMKRLGMVCTSGTAPKDAADQLSVLDAILEHKRVLTTFRAGEALGASLFGAQWQGEHRTNWQVLRQLFVWIVELHEQVGGGALPKAFLDFLSGSPDLKPLDSPAQEVLGSVKTARDAVRAAVTVLDMDEAKCLSVHAAAVDSEKSGIAEQPFIIQEAIATGWAESAPRVQEIAVFNHLSDQLAQVHLTPVTEVASAWSEASERLAASFRFSWYGALLGGVWASRPEVSAFSGATHGTVVADFRRLDALARDQNKAVLALKHWQALPPHPRAGDEGTTGLGILLKEFNKSRRHLPLRQLMEKASEAIQAIKPIFLMSPLSVATYLPRGQVTFDLVIFDEASQVKPVDAFGALLRGRQAVVVGDSKQLPPTNFFDKLESQETDEASDTADQESILGLFAAQGAPERMLQWHYRSRHESLIAVSNQEFYDSKLVIFPSPDASRRTLGLIYHHLSETVYDRGGSGTNRREARAVAEAVLAHARTQLLRPRGEWETLGVAAFSMGQRQAVADQIEALRLAHPECEPYFTSLTHEPFFVKNLENVQGDERDIIYISVGYGRDREGKLSMNFGPLNTKGGERRLNVLITRARLRCEVFTNLSPDDIRVDKEGPKGLNSFKEFLRFARAGQGQGALGADQDGESRQPFESVVLSALAEMGYEAVPQVGCAGYFVDIAVRDPNSPGRYVLGIECDGPNYNSARSARDRDRLRAEVLARMGWRMHRIWSTDWVNRYEVESQRLRQAVEAALADAAQKQAEEAEKASALSEADTEGNPSVTGGDLSLTVTDSGNDAGGGVERVNAEREAGVIAPYDLADLPVQEGIAISDLTTRTVADLVASVVEIESPVHLSEVTRRIAESLPDGGRVAKTFKEAMETACADACSQNLIRREGDFLWKTDMVQPPLRSRIHLDARARSVSVIASAEIGRAIQHIVSVSYGIGREEIARKTARLFGIERMTAESRNCIDAVVDTLLTSGTLTENGDRIGLAE